MGIVYNNGDFYCLPKRQIFQTKNKDGTSANNVLSFILLNIPFIENMFLYPVPYIVILNSNHYKYCKIHIIIIEQIFIAK